MSTCEWHTDNIRVHTSDIGMTYQYIWVTYEWHTSTYDWHANDIRNIKLYNDCTIFKIVLKTLLYADAKDF